MKHTNALRATIAITGIAALALLPTGCSNKDADSGQATIKIAYPNWAEGIAMTNLVDHLLEKRFDRKVELTMADPGLVYASLADGSEDILLDAWLPTTHASYMKQYGDRLEDLGANFQGAKIGLVVPDYVEVNSIADLPAHASEFDGQIIGIGQGAGIMKKTLVASKSYGLDSLELVPSSGPAMTTALGDAIDKHKPIVVTGWEPHWMFARYKLKFLEDPQGVYGTSEMIKTIARKGFEEANPKVAAFLRRMQMDSTQLGSLMDGIRNADSDQAKDAAVQAWVDAHEELVNSWLQDPA